MKNIIRRFKQAPAFQRWTIVTSLVLFLASLTQQAFLIDRKEDPDAYSYSLILFFLGWMSFLGGALIPFLIWLANPVYIYSIVLTIKGKISGFYFSIGATILAIIFSQLDSIMTSESGSTSKITSLRLGFYLWLASFVVLAVGNSINLILIKRRPNI